mmetsp:Transcript_16627/g.64924  ORF Transcript_16627/g.64924 Transcript_16627/m.64924 type:complete len:175 (+) Transcript_16627:1-525(+)
MTVKRSRARNAQLQDCIHHLNTDKTFKACNSMVLRKYVPIGKLQRIAMQDAAFASGGSAADGVVDMTVKSVEVTGGDERKSGKKRKREDSSSDEGVTVKRKKKQLKGSLSTTNGVSDGKEAKRAAKEKEKAERKAKKKEEKREKKQVLKDEKKRAKKEEKRAANKEAKRRAKGK